MGCALPAVFCPWSCVSLPLVRGPFLVVFLLCWCFCPRWRVSFRGRRAPFWGWLGLFVSVLCLAVVGSLPCRLLLPFPLRLVPCGVLAQFLRWSLPLGIWLLLVTAWLPCLTAKGIVVLCRPHLFCLLAAKAFGPVWGLFYPLHHDACVVRVLSITTLRYSSVMIQVPHWTPLSYTFAILGCKCGILRPCPLLPSRRPLSRSCCGCVVVCCSLVPSVSSCNLPCPHLGA